MASVPSKRADFFSDLEPYFVDVMLPRGYNLRTPSPPMAKNNCFPFSPRQRARPRVRRMLAELERRKLGIRSDQRLSSSRPNLDTKSEEKTVQIHRPTLKRPRTSLDLYASSDCDRDSLYRPGSIIEHSNTLNSPIMTSPNLSQSCATLNSHKYRRRSSVGFPPSAATNTAPNTWNSMPHITSIGSGRRARLGLRIDPTAAYLPIDIARRRPSPHPMPFKLLATAHSSISERTNNIAGNAGCDGRAACARRVPATGVAVTPSKRRSKPEANSLGEPCRLSEIAELEMLCRGDSL
mmetsp:Transcript_3852/g.5921  ORF Transcript_3852/g.5921 Transcript_3852/m.5921 type:complete len:294 (-) Transcript_3852:244-1125(-)